MALSPLDASNDINSYNNKEAISDSDIDARIEREAEITAQAKVKCKESVSPVNYIKQYFYTFPFLLILVAIAAIIICTANTHQKSANPLSASTLAPASLQTGFMLPFAEFKDFISKANPPFSLKEFYHSRLEISLGLLNSSIPLNCDEALFKDRCPGLLYLKLNSSGSIQSAVLILQRPVKNTNGYLKYKVLTAKELESIEAFNAQAAECLIKAFTAKSGLLSTWDLGEILSKFTECSLTDTCSEMSYPHCKISISPSALGLDQIITVELDMF